jgi:hypothetical protein
MRGRKWGLRQKKRAEINFSDLITTRKYDKDFYLKLGTKLYFISPPNSHNGQEENKRPRSPRGGAST